MIIYYTVDYCNTKMVKKISVKDQLEKKNYFLSNMFFLKMSLYTYVFSIHKIMRVCVCV